MIKIGFWCSESESHLPKPQDLVDPTWDPEERQLVTDWLRTGSQHDAFKGSSSCRFCDKANGSRDLTDGIFLWPSGLVHYLEAHQVRLPQVFVDHVRTQLALQPDRTRLVKMAQGLRERLRGRR